MSDTQTAPAKAQSKKDVSTKKDKKGTHISFWKLFCWKSSDMGQGVVAVITLTYLTIYCTDSLGMNPAVVGTLLLVSRIVEAIANLVAGYIVDSTHTKLGKARPYELCIIGVMLSTLLMFAASPSWSQTAKCIWIFCMYTLDASVFQALRGASMTPYTIRAFHNDQTLITKVASFGAPFTTVVSLLVSVVFPVAMGKIATSARGWTALVAIFIIPALLISLLRFFNFKEDPSIDAASQKKISFKEVVLMLRRNKYVWIFAIIMLLFNITTSIGVTTYYFKWIIGDVKLMSISSALGIIMVPFMLVMPRLMKKIGSLGDMVFIFALMGAAGYLIAFLGGSNIVVVLIGMLFGSLATLPLSYYGVLFVMNICAYNQMKGLARMDASAQAVGSVFGKLGTALASAITGGLMAASGYVSGTHVTSQPGSALMMIRILFAIVPMICMIVIALCAKSFAKLEKTEIPAWKKSHTPTAAPSSAQAQAQSSASAPRSATNSTTASETASETTGETAQSDRTASNGTSGVSTSDPQ
jgi:Na+/melibiose symporter-like transporter